MTVPKPYRLKVSLDHDNALRLELWQVGYSPRETERTPLKVGTLRGVPLTVSHTGLVELLQKEGYGPGWLTRPQPEPAELTENTGILLALWFRLVQPVKKIERIQNIIQGLARMTPDERQYFFARIRYPGKGRYMERALRLWLGE
ncbi:hypothetical protein Sulac_0064 [Sulfobacillus acidophilus DSM 10332]|uniref:DUF7680 domain-containing protein n=1 Tax=Sulfobacillus acidophilus (strain ATCC 700253 / DSM 10332 / NAL) TaxID=679936 RepID=G8TVJ9_SULAD|nr:hypothetical protein Sulac_0064 [Sulfobacillus acidophilus DSM 10332]